uniref:Reverse transcriptase domain-containing protein n=1 Tax=Strongyloides venezuelensis TaxID=75913 RepID=A0A0K0FX68_STRVS
FKLDPADYNRFGVYTPWGCYRYLRLPQGFCNSPSICQEIMDRVTRETQFATSFLDDVIISTRPNREFHLKEVRNTLRAFKDFGLKLNEKKCVFMSKEITFLGHRINHEGISPDQTNVDTICKIQPPTNLKQLRMFIGAVGFFSMFIPKYSSIMKPLFDLLKKDKPFVWSTEHQNAFEAAKNSLLSSKVLAHYDPAKELYIFTDASQKGYSGVLCQKFDANFRPIMYWSKSRPN